MITELTNPYIYIEYVLAVVLLTQVIKGAFKEADLHPKWITLVVGIVMAIVGIVIQETLLNNAIEFWKLITSFGIACLFYDYLLKVIQDKFFKRE